MARPVNAASEMGVPRTRCGPNSLTKGGGASVARWIVRGSRRISSSMASIPAAAYEICRIAWLLFEGLLAVSYWLLAYSIWLAHFVRSMAYGKSRGEAIGYEPLAGC